MQIHELQNSTSVFASDDFVIVSGQTNNTRKMSKDALLEQTATNTLTKGVAPAFSTETAYAVGDLVIYQGQLYRCTTAHTGAWASGHFTATDANTEMARDSVVKNLSDSLAPEFDSTVAYTKGQFVTYQCKIYQFTSNHAAGAWNASHATVSGQNALLKMTAENALASIKDIPTSISQFRTRDVIPVDGPNGPAKMGKDDLLKETAQNALAGNLAPLFDPSKPNDAGGYAYYAGNNVTYDGQNFVFIANHKAGAWNPLEVEHKPLSESINLQGVGEAVDEWLNNHPEATTTVPDGSLTKEKFSDLLQQECLNNYVTPEMFGAVGDSTADDTTAMQACLDYAFANGKSTYLSKSYKITASLDVHDWCVIRGNGGIKSKVTNRSNIRFAPPIGSTSADNPMSLFVCNDTTISRKHHSFIDVSIFKASGTAICFGNTCKIDNSSIITGCVISTFDIVIDGSIGHLVRIECNTFYAVYRAFITGMLDDSYIINNYISGYRPFAPVCFKGPIYHSEISDNFFDFWFGIFRDAYNTRIANNIFDYCFWIFGYTLYYGIDKWKPAGMEAVTITGNVLTSCANCNTSSSGFGSVLTTIANSPEGAFKVKLLTDWFPSAFCVAFFDYNETTDTIKCRAYYTNMRGSITGNMFDGGIVLLCLPCGLIMKGNTYSSINSNIPVEEQPRVYLSFAQPTVQKLYDAHSHTEIDLFDHMQFATKPELFKSHTIFGGFELYIEGCTVWYDKKLYKGYWAPGMNNFHFYDVNGNLPE